MIFELMFSPTLGIINALTGLNIKWLNDKDTALWVLIIIQVWMNLGYNFLFILSAVRGIDADKLEAADVERLCFHWYLQLFSFCSVIHLQK